MQRSKLLVFSLIWNALSKKETSRSLAAGFSSIYREEIEYELKDWASREKRMKIKMLIELFF